MRKDRLRIAWHKNVDTLYNASVNTPATTPAIARPVLRTTDDAPEEEPLELELELDDVGAEETEVPLEGGAVAMAPTPPVLGPLSATYDELYQRHITCCCV